MALAVCSCESECVVEYVVRLLVRIRSHILFRLKCRHEALIDVHQSDTNTNAHTHPLRSASSSSPGTISAARCRRAHVPCVPLARLDPTNHA